MERRRANGGDERQGWGTPEAGGGIVPRESGQKEMVFFKIRRNLAVLGGEGRLGEGWKFGRSSQILGV